MRPTSKKGNATRGRAFRAGTPRLLFDGGFDPGIGRIAPFDVSADGQRFLTTQDAEAASPRINVVLNWHEELRRLVPTN